MALGRLRRSPCLQESQTLRPSPYSSTAAQDLQPIDADSTEAIVASALHEAVKRRQLDAAAR